MRGETKIAVAFTGLLACGAGLILAQAGREPSAKVQFSEARFANGQARISYSYSVSSGTSLHETEFKDGVKIGESIGSPSGDSSSTFPISDLPATPPSMLVSTGKTYYLKLNAKLPIYDFTNNSGTTYRALFSLESP